MTHPLILAMTHPLILTMTHPNHSTPITGSYHCLALTEPSGQIVSWGAGDYGQLGTETLTNTVIIIRFQTFLSTHFYPIFSHTLFHTFSPTLSYLLSHTFSDSLASYLIPTLSLWPLDNDQRTRARQSVRRSLTLTHFLTCLLTPSLIPTHPLNILDDGQRTRARQSVRRECAEDNSGSAECDQVIAFTLCLMHSLYTAPPLTTL